MIEEAVKKLPIEYKTAEEGRWVGKVPAKSKVTSET